MLKEITQIELALVCGATNKALKQSNFNLDNAAEYVARARIAQNHLLYAASGDASLINGTAEPNLKQYNNVEYHYMSWVGALGIPVVLSLVVTAIIAFGAACLDGGMNNNKDVYHLYHVLHID